MVDKKILDKTLVVTFSQGERTEDLCDLCYEKLGFKNRILLNSKGGFHDKFLEFAQIAANSQYEFFIRNDSDRLVFDGILKILDTVSQDPDLMWSTGEYFDYIMNRFRGGTPTVHRKAPLIYLNDNQHMMQDVQKPEGTFARSIKSKFKMTNVKILTNLHEYEQYPSKVCNAFLNRLGRNHYPRLYDNNYLNSLPDHYKQAIQHAFNAFNKQGGSKNSMVFQDFTFLDKESILIDKTDLEDYYNTYLSLYNKLKKYT